MGGSAPLIVPAQALVAISQLELIAVAGPASRPWYFDWCRCDEEWTLRAPEKSRWPPVVDSGR